jgi:trigger factor
MTDEPRPEDQAPETSPTETSATATETPPAEGEEKAKKLEQTVEMKDVGPCRKHVKVTVDRKAIDERLKDKFGELVHNANVPGFRPGKAPSRLVQRRYRTEVSGQVKTEVLLASLEQLADETDLAPLSPPNIDPDRIELPEQGPFIYEFEVEVRPEFDLPEYKGLKLKRPVYTFTDADVDREQRRLLTPQGQVVPKPEGNAQIGDVVVADLTFKFGDQVINEAKEISLRIEKKLILRDSLCPKFAESVAGANAGDTRIIDMEVSTQAANPELRGQTVQMVTAIKDVKTVRLPELNEEFLQQFGVKTIEQLRELIKVVLERQLEFRQRQAARQQITAHIAASANWELPQDLLIRQARKAMARKVMEMRADNIAEEQIQQQQRLLQQNILQSTELALKEHFVLQKIAEVEKIEVNDEDLDAEIERMAEQSDESPRRIRARLEREDLLDAVAAEMIERKVLNLILESATYEDTPVGEDLQEAVAEVEQQAVPGEMRDIEAEAAESTRQAAESESAQS